MINVMFLPLGKDGSTCAKLEIKYINKTICHFDKVAHNRLLYKLSSYVVKGNTLGWIGSLLPGRSQQVVL